ncbi:MAG: hypothetical protein ABSE52_09355 [Candidatus Dormibacteria bacterium]|jgi:hypothetical protein
MGMARSGEHRYLQAWNCAAEVEAAATALAPPAVSEEDAGPHRGLIRRARFRRRARL